MQQWIGDQVDIGPGKFLGNRVHVPMATAIVRTYTPEGFVIAADGLACDADGIVKDDRVKKIFPVGGSGSEPAFLAYSISGAASIAPLDQSKPYFSFCEEINKTAQSLSLWKHSSLIGFAN
jgi:hypothetical protein